jgi:hypothetical protein
MELLKKTKGKTKFILTRHYFNRVSQYKQQNILCFLSSRMRTTPSVIYERNSNQIDDIHLDFKLYSELWQEKFIFKGFTTNHIILFPLNRFALSVKTFCKLRVLW